MMDYDTENCSQIETHDRQKEAWEFQKMPVDLQRAVIGKLEFGDWLQLRQCSTYSNELCDSQNYFLPLKRSHVLVFRNSVVFANSQEGAAALTMEEVNMLPCRMKCSLLFLTTILTKRMAKYLQEVFRKKRVTIRKVRFSDIVMCDGQDLNELFELGAPLRLHSTSRFIFDFFDYSYASKLQDSVCLDRCSLEGRHLTAMKAIVIVAKDVRISGTALGQFLTEWHRGERRVLSLQLEFENGHHFDFNQLFASFSSLSPIWTPQLHPYSLIGAIPYDEISDAQRAHPSSFYATWKANDVSTMYILEISDRSISFGAGFVYHIFSGMLTYNQHFEVLGCRYCFERDDCSHISFMADMP